MNYKEETKYQLESKLKAAGLSIAEVKKLLGQISDQPDYHEQEHQKFFDFFKSTAKASESSNYAVNCTYFPDCNCKTMCNTPRNSPEDRLPQGSVTFVASSVPSRAKVYVEDTLVKGVLSAILEYDVDREFPVLHLEILAPIVITES
jgi:hypothetical protein